MKQALLCVAVLGSLGTAHAAPDTDEDELALIYGDRFSVSIATGSQLSLRRAPAVAAVITADMIAAMGATDLGQVLEGVAGMHVGRSSNSWTQLFIIRGIYQQYNAQTLMLQNGVPMTTLLVGNKGNVWGNYPIDNIARIEIIRGPGSALYGADAFAGVINIITKTVADMPGTTVGGNAGSFRTGNAFVRYAGQAGPFTVAAYAAHGSSAGAGGYIGADAQTVNDKNFGTHASNAPGQVHNAYRSIDAALDIALGEWRWRSGIKHRSGLGAGAGISQALDPNDGTGSQRINSDLSWTSPQIADAVSAGASLSYLTYKQFFDQPLTIFPPGLKFPSGLFPQGMRGAPATWEHQWRASAYVSYTGWDKHRLRVGIGHDDLDLFKVSELKNFTFLPNGLPVPAGEVKQYAGPLAFLEPQRRTVSYLYAQDEWQFAQDFTLTAGLRRDRFSDFGATTNPRLALVWDASLDLTAKLMYGQAFRAPSFTEEFSINNPVVIGNRNLLPERMRTLEAALAWQAGKDLKLNATFFRYAMHDILRTVPNVTPGTGATWQNIGSQSGHGMELEADWQINRSLQWLANYSYQRGTDGATGKEAGYMPHHHVYTRLDWHLDAGWRVGPQLNWVGQRLRPPGDLRAPLKAYTSVDVSLRKEPGKSRWSYAASVQNLANADIREPSAGPGTAIPGDLPMAPRSLTVQASYRF